MMKAGTYYVGDLCYVMHNQWNEVCALTINDKKCLSGEFKMKDGTDFAIYGTYWGDGTYEDQNSIEYSVDSGTIGCILTKFLDPKELDDAINSELAHIVEFEHDFSTSCDEGEIAFGSVVIINTDYVDEYIDDEYEDEDE